jgi:hypothetical protein
VDDEEHGAAPEDRADDVHDAQDEQGEVHAPF